MLDALEGCCIGASVNKTNYCWMSAKFKLHVEWCEHMLLHSVRCEIQWVSENSNAFLLSTVTFEWCWSSCACVSGINHHHHTPISICNEFEHRRVASICFSASNIYCLLPLHLKMKREKNTAITSLHLNWDKRVPISKKRLPFEPSNGYGISTLTYDDIHLYT